ncbi:MAG: hypothetical protein ACOC6G_04600 [Thermoproteota archaeon]
MSKALQIYPTVNIERLPRMVDFAVWGEDISRALGYQPGEFINAYREKIGEQVVDVLEENPIGLAILLFMRDRREWRGRPGELLEALEDPEFVEENQIDVEAKKWPGSASWVTRRVKEVETNLEHEGVHFSTCRESGTGRSLITLERCEGSEGSESISPTKKDEGKHENVNRNIPKSQNQQGSVDIREVKSGKVSTGNAFTGKMPSQTQQDFTFQKIPPGEKCSYCGVRGVEYEIIDVETGIKLRKCSRCFRDMRDHYRTATWRRTSRDR